jgi:hypothetical protein
MKKLSARHLHRLSMKAGSRVVNSSSDKTKRESSQDRAAFVRQRSGSLGGAGGAPADASSKSPPPGQRPRGFSIDDDDDDDGKISIPPSILHLCMSSLLWMDNLAVCVRMVHNLQLFKNRFDMNWPDFFLLLIVCLFLHRAQSV